MDQQPERPRRRRKHSAPKRALAALACFLFVVGLVMSIFVGFNLVVITMLAAAVLGIVGPAASAASDGVFEVFVQALELIVEGFMMFIEGIAGLFSG